MTVFSFNIQSVCADSMSGYYTGIDNIKDEILSYDFTSEQKTKIISFFDYVNSCLQTANTQYNFQVLHDSGTKDWGMTLYYFRHSGEYMQNYKSSTMLGIRSSTNQYFNYPPFVEYEKSL